MRGRGAILGGAGASALALMVLVVLPGLVLAAGAGCANGGAAVDGGGCACPIFYTGPQCAGRQCPNSAGGAGPHRVRPINPASGLCDACAAADFGGMNCQLCRRNAACAGEGGVCDRSLAIRGASKQFQCRLRPSYFVEMMGGGREIAVDILLNCTAPDGRAFRSGRAGECHMGLYRIEGAREFVDAFFRCDTTQCTMRYATKTGTGAPRTEATTETWVDGAFAFVRIAGRVGMLGLCATLVLLGVFARSLGYKHLRRFTMLIGGALCVTTALYIFLMVLSMRVADPEAVVVYECGKTSCACAEDPPERYQPRCSETEILVNQVLPSIQNGVRIECNIASGACQLTLTDIMLVFDVDCEAAECVDESQFPITPDDDDDDSGGGDATASKLHLLLKVLFAAANLSLVGVLIHWLYLRKRSRQRIIEFLLLFHIDASPAIGENVMEYSDEEVGDANMPVDMSPLQSLRPASPSPGTPYLQSRDDPPNDDHSYEAASAPLLGGSSRGQRAVSSWARGMFSTSTPRPTAGSLDPFSLETREEIGKIRALMRSPLQLRVEGLQYTLKAPFFAQLQEGICARVILHQIHFTVRSGDVLAIMGPSGAGKTTLLDLLSVRSKSGVVHGEVLLNGSLVSTIGSHAAQYRNVIGYVSQEDTLLPALTVRQTLEYAARLKLPTAFSKRTLDSVVDRMIDICKLQQCEHTMVGGGGSGVRGISGGERRRVSVAVELLANPRLLFLDEPTSGLDAVSARRMIEAVVKLAKDSSMRSYSPHFFAFNPIVVFSIHQPSQEIFTMFDNVLLLSKGMSVYCGPARAAAATLERRVSEAFGGTRAIPSRADHPNEAEYLMKLEELLDDNVRMELQQHDIRANAERYPGEWWVETGGGEDAEAQEVAEGYAILKAAADLRVYYMNAYQQLGLLTSRSIASLVSSFHLVMSHAAVVVCMASLMCCLYKEQALDLAGALNREGSVTFLLLVTSFVSLSCLESLIVERKLFIVERENGFYTTLPYFISKLVVDIFPLRIIPSVVLSSAIYFSMGFRTDSGEHFLWFIVIITLFSVCMTLLVMCVGIVMESFGASALLSSVFILLFLVFGGALVQSETIPDYLKPFRSVSPFFLSFESLMINELDKQSCVFSPTDETGKKSSNSISIQCRQYLFNAGLKPNRFSLDVMQLGLICFLLVLVAWTLLATFTKLVR